MFLENGVVLCLKWDGMVEMLAYNHRWWMKVSNESQYVPDLVTSGSGIEQFFRIVINIPF